MLAKSMFVLSTIGLIDSISYMAVAPSLIFYVLELGGTKEQYGLIMSIFSFASFAAKPVYGRWVDSIGSKYRVPYLCSFAIAVCGAVLYFLAVLAPPGSSTAVAMVFVGRFLSGVGAANQALGYAYIASVVEQDMQTRTSTILSMMRIVGMTIGPGINYFLAKVDTTFLGVPVEPLNSVGLLLAVGNLITAFMVFFVLPEPPEKKKIPSLDNGGGSSNVPYWNALLSLDIMLPMLILFVANSAFQLIETALPPAAAHGLGWGPVETSGVLGATSFVIFGCMMLVVYLSGKKVSDTTLVVIGSIFFTIGGVAIYFLWTDESLVWHFVVPVMIAIAGFPFIASPNRSNFTKAVMSKSALEAHQATMSAILSMTASAAGFLTPGFVAAYVVRSPEEVIAAGDQRELTVYALYAPLLCLLSLLGLYYNHVRHKQMAHDLEQVEGVPGEGTPLVKKRETRRSSVMELNQRFSRKYEVARRSSVEVMGFMGIDTFEEKNLRDMQLKDLEELMALEAIDFEADENDPIN